MSIGYFIGLGDKTECGGEVLEGDYGISWNGIVHALEGHKVSCGVDGETYEIVGGVSSFSSSGRRVAGTLDSLSSCPCRAQLLPTISTASYHAVPSPAVRPARAPSSAASSTPPGTAQGGAFDEQFSLVDVQGKPHCTLKYVLLQGDQRVASGSLDAQGCCASQCSPNPARMTFATHFPSPGLE